MTTTAPHGTKAQDARTPWRGWKGGLWQKEINVRDFIQQNYEPYEGDEAFLASATERTEKIWGRLQELFVEERKKGVLDVSRIPSSASRTSWATCSPRPRRWSSERARSFGRRG